MSAQDNKAINDRVAEAIMAGDLGAFDELMSPDLAQEFREAFPDYHGTNETQIAEGDLVASHFVFRGTHRGEFMGIAPTGREVRIEGLSLVRVTSGKIVELRVEWDVEAVLKQMGAVLRAEPSEEAGPA